MRILILRFSSLGDIILTMPVVKAIRKQLPDAEVDLATKTEYKDLFISPSPFNKVIFLDKEGIIPFAKKLSELNYDLIADLHGSLRTTIMMPFLKAAAKKRYKKGTIARRLFVDSGIRITSFPSVIERYADVFNIQEIPEAPWFDIDERNRHTGYRILKEAGVVGDRVAGIAPGAGWRTKKWDIQRYTELAQRLEEKSIDVVFIIGKGDEMEREALRSESSHFRILDTFQYLLKDIGYAISVMDIFVSGDTGLMHIAEAAGTPVVAMFGPTTRELGFFPTGSKNIVIQKNLSCRPCSLHGSDRCRHSHHKCMDDITVDEVESNVLRLVGTVQRSNMEIV